MGKERQFRTFQTRENYESSIKRHAQYIRWMQTQLCPCANSISKQADLQCDLCFGKGIYKIHPSKFQILNERIHITRSGFAKIKRNFIPGSVQIFLRGKPIEIKDINTLELKRPYPREYEPFFASYDFTVRKTVRSETPKIYLPNILEMTENNFFAKHINRSIPITIVKVLRIANVTQDVVYKPIKTDINFIYVDLTGYQKDDILKVDYEYVEPFEFVLFGVTPKMAYNQAYIAEEATASLITPYWALTGHTDLFTQLSSNQIGNCVMSVAKNENQDDLHKITGYTDIVKLISVIDKDGKEYAPDTEVKIIGRDNLKWLVNKPSERYSVKFYYNPTYTALPNMATLRTSENKAFANKISLKLNPRLNSNE